MRQTNHTNPVHRFVAMFCFLLSGTVAFITLASLLTGPQNFFDVMLYLAMATILALFSAIYSVPEADPEETSDLPVTRRSHLEKERMRRFYF